MATPRIRLLEHVRRTIAELHPQTKRKVRAAIDAIAEDPTIGEPLQQELAGFRKVALGSWRIVYRQEGRVVVVRAVGRRATVYSDLIDHVERRLSERARRYRRARSARVRGADARRTRTAGSRGRAR